MRRAAWEDERQGDEPGIRFSAETRSLEGVSEGTEDGTEAMTWD